MWSLVTGFYDSYLGTTVPTVDPTGTIAPDIDRLRVIGSADAMRARGVELTERVGGTEMVEGRVPLLSEPPAEEPRLLMDFRSRR